MIYDIVIFTLHLQNKTNKKKVTKHACPLSSDTHFTLINKLQLLEFRHYYFNNILIIFAALYPLLKSGSVLKNSNCYLYHTMKSEWTICGSVSVNQYGLVFSSVRHNINNIHALTHKLCPLATK